MKKFYNIGEYEQWIDSNGEYNCTCRWSTIEISRFPKNPEKRKKCIHIKLICKQNENKQD
jgi:hypothetical protein